ncbi:ATP-binding cassette domain-containing protein [Salipiger mangrovisoli]|uniref:ATP-binding cassette domain-containing protein n=1 Tax=Salipiger mangrovisoli TaxID=2865933 RepID=A0ABR9X9A8_9RHOB|nr:ATP-binding cassette domain-containing protein [Salipiger mangrovisoli]MBE9640133.1 ATP-binding cassette domain-containing protein [Salipiger mangrovisoli]
MSGLLRGSESAHSPHLTVRQNIASLLRTVPARLPGAALFSTQTRAAASEIEARTLEIALMLRLGALLDCKPDQLCGGQQQHVALAPALVRDPAAFLLDAPLKNLDTALRHSTCGAIREVNWRTGQPFLLLTHDRADVLSIAGDDRRAQRAMRAACRYLPSPRQP